jgi:hypothetical protein
MTSPPAYYVANRILWAVALLVGPIAGAIAREPLVGVLVVGLFMLAALVFFDTDRSWWSAAIKRLPEDPDRSRSESRKLTVSSAIALLTGLAIALIHPWD